MEEATRELVRKRAGNRCEYCGVAQRYYPDFTFHVEHVVARQHGGESDADNLALACHLCNLKKGPNLSGLDPDSGQLTALFNPRTTHGTSTSSWSLTGKSWGEPRSDEPRSACSG